MPAEVDRHIHGLEEQLGHYFKVLETLTEEQFHTQPQAGEWSICQILEHLFMSESGTLGYMLKKTSSGWEVLETESEEHRHNGEALSARLQTGEKFRAPAILPDPPNQITIEEIKKNWVVLRQKLFAFVRSVPAEEYNKLLFKQPYAGMISLPKTVAFLYHHIAHHRSQLESTLQRIAH
jgi:DinB superfamily